MKDWPGGSYFAMKSTLRVPGCIPLMAIGYKCNSRKVLGYISAHGAVSNEPGDTCLSYLFEIFRPVARPHFLGRYFNAYNAI